MQKAARILLLGWITELGPIRIEQAARSSVAQKLLDAPLQSGGLEEGLQEGFASVPS
jgi:hypothetical protein